MDGYVKYGLVQDAGQSFDEMSERMVVDWNLMISGYWSWGNEVKARHLFQMIPDRNVITSNAMRPRGGVSTFNRMPEKKAVSWNAMLSGYAQNGFAEEAVELINEMMNASVQADKTFWVAVISSCSSHGDPCLAKSLVKRLDNKGISMNCFVKMALHD
ncbi:hypothetical protein LguiA_008153 [Lonicera macranthoides]